MIASLPVTVYQIPKLFLYVPDPNEDRVGDDHQCEEGFELPGFHLQKKRWANDLENWPHPPFLCAFVVKFHKVIKCPCCFFKARLAKKENLWLTLGRKSSSSKTPGPLSSYGTSQRSGSTRSCSWSEPERRPHLWYVTEITAAGYGFLPKLRWHPPVIFINTTWSTTINSHPTKNTHNCQISDFIVWGTFMTAKKRTETSPALAFRWKNWFSLSLTSFASEILSNKQPEFHLEMSALGCNMKQPEKMQKMHQETMQHVQLFESMDERSCEEKPDRLFQLGKLGSWFLSAPDL